MANNPRFKVGDRVAYHAIIGGPVTSTHEVRYVQPEGIPSHQKPVYWLKGKAGCVAEAALTLAENDDAE